MSVLRLTNGSDVAIKLSVEDTIAAVHITTGVDDFVELPGEEGPIHVRPSSVIAILENADHKTSGFRVLRD